MTPFSASDAALEGFNLIRRQWRIVLGWAGFNLVALVLLVVVTAVMGVVAAAVGGGAKESVTAVAGGVVGVGALVIQAIIAGGVFRVELRPDEPAFMHLRLGADEFRLLGVWFVTLTGAWVALWAATLLGGLIHVRGLWLDLVAAVLLIGLGLRFSLAAPICFADGRIDFLRSWRLTRGRALALLGMQALSLCLIGLVMVAVLLALSLVAARSAGLDGIAAAAHPQPVAGLASRRVG